MQVDETVNFFFPKEHMLMKYYGYFLAPKLDLLAEGPDFLCHGSVPWHSGEASGLHLRLFLRA